MATIAQKTLFEWNDVEDIGDLIRLRFAVDNLPDEPLMYALEKKRDKGRNDYPIRAMWDSVIAGVVFTRETVESLRRCRGPHCCRSDTRLLVKKLPA